MNCRTTARASDPVLTIPIWMDSIPPFSTSASCRLSSEPCPCAQSLTSNSACLMHRNPNVRRIPRGRGLPPHWGLDGERDHSRAARGHIGIRGDPERNKICRRQFCLPLWAEDRLTQQKRRNGCKPRDSSRPWWGAIRRAMGGKNRACSGIRADFVRTLRAHHKV
jgi:hypothetical protein